MVNIETELKNIRKLKSEILKESDKQTEPRKWYYGNLINESLFEQYKTLDKMQDMLVRSGNSLNEELYNEYKKSLTNPKKEDEEEISDKTQPTQKTNASLDLKEEMAQIKNRKKEIIYDATYNVPAGEIRKSYNGTIIREKDFEEFKALSQMEDMIRDENVLNVTIYLKYKATTNLGKKQTSALTPSNINLEAIQKRLAEIRYRKQTATGNREIVIAGGDPVLKEDSKEYAELKQKEQELKNQALSTERKQQSLADQQGENVEKLIEEEKQLLKRKMASYEQKGKDANPFDKKIETDNGKVLLLKNLGDYDKINDLLELIEAGFTTPDAENYNDLRALTSLGKMDDDKFKKIYEYFKKKNISTNRSQEQTQNQNTAQTQNTTPIQEDEEEELVEVVKTSKWEWVKKHKKGIIIGLGITAVTVSVALLMAQLIPAITAANKASQIAGIINQMMVNGEAWNGATPAVQGILHGGNRVLAQAASSLTGIPNAFNASTGVWTFGAQTLPQFASSANAAIAPALAKVASISKIAAGTAASGLGLSAIGGIIPKSKSKEYKAINKNLKEFRANTSKSSEEQINSNAENIKTQIINSDKLSEVERNVLLKRLSKYTNHLLIEMNSYNTMVNVGAVSYGRSM